MYVHRHTVGTCNDVYARYYSKATTVHAHTQEHSGTHQQAGDAEKDKFTFHIKNMGPGTFTQELNVLAPAYDTIGGQKDGNPASSRQLAVVGA